APGLRRANAVAVGDAHPPQLDGVGAAAARVAVVAMAVHAALRTAVAGAIDRTAFAARAHRRQRRTRIPLWLRASALRRGAQRLPRAPAPPRSAGRRAAGRAAADAARRALPGRAARGNPRRPA